MNPDTCEKVVLRCHPAGRVPWVKRLGAKIVLDRGGQLRLTYELTGELSRILIPQPDASSRVDGLWRHTCFEVFLKLPATQPYWEYNFSPSTAWQHYGFDGYRRNCSRGTVETPRVRCERDAGRLRLAVRLRPPFGIESSPVMIGVAAVLEDIDGGCSFWALKHAGSQPDFHDPTTFCL